MRVILDLNNPVVKQEFMLKQREIVEKIKRRWENGIKYNSSNPPTNIKNVFGFHFG